MQCGPPPNHHLIRPAVRDCRLMVDRITQRREAKVAAIVESAWKLAREHGMAGVSLHALAREVGMRQPSLYAYFDSKLALYDAMFADGNRQLLERLDLVKLPRDPRAALKKFLAEFVAFALEDPARYELLFERHVPGFTPSPASYAPRRGSVGTRLQVDQRGRRHRTG